MWSWHPLLMLSLAEARSARPGYEMPRNSRGDGGQRNSAPRRSRISRKTIAWGMPDVFRCLRCEYSCAYFTTHSAHEAAGALGTRHSPRPLHFRGRTFRKTRARCAATTRSHVCCLTFESESKCGRRLSPRRPGRVSRGSAMRCAPRTRSGIHNHQSLLRTKLELPVHRCSKMVLMNSRLSPGSRVCRAEHAGRLTVLPRGPTAR